MEKGERASKAEDTAQAKAWRCEVPGGDIPEQPGGYHLLHGAWHSVDAQYIYKCMFARFAEHVLFAQLMYLRKALGGLLTRRKARGSSSLELLQRERASMESLVPQ